LLKIDIANGNDAIRNVLSGTYDGNYLLSAVTLQGNNGEIIAGNAIVDYGSEEPILSLKNDDAKSSETIRIDVGTAYVGQYEHLIYFPLPEMTFEKGITVKVEMTDVTTTPFSNRVIEVSTNKPIVIEQGKIKSMAALDGKELFENAPEAYAELLNDVLTFYYDGEKDQRTGDVFMYDDIVVDHYRIYGEDGWYTNVQRIAFDSSFSEYKPITTNGLFSYMSSLKTIEGVEYLDTSNVTNMYGMFSFCTSLTNIDLSGFDTSNVTNMAFMFDCCLSLKSLVLSNFDTSNVTNMEYMFDECSTLTVLDVSNFDTSKVTTMWHMFQGCSSLTSLDVSGFDTSKVTITGWMFDRCYSLTSLDVSGFNTVNMMEMYGMFSGCSSLTSLDVSGFDTSNVTDMSYMFDGCTSLQTIYANDWSNSSVEKSDGMFRGCSSLIGSQGTCISILSGELDSNYAHIDGGRDNPGLFTSVGSNIANGNIEGFDSYDHDWTGTSGSVESDNGENVGGGSSHGI